MWRRLRALIIKELLAVLRDPRSRLVLIGPPVLQMFLFSYAATLDVRNIDIAVENRDAGRWSIEFMHRLDGAEVFRSIERLTSEAQIQRAIDNRDVIAALRFGETFSSDIAAGRPAEVQVLLDGRRSNAAQIVFGYLNTIAGDVSRTIQLKPVGMATADKSAATGGNTNERDAVSTSPLVVRHWFNANLIYMWFTVPGLLGTLTLLIALVVTGQSVARERELGTFDQLLVSPLRTGEILLGKTLPPLIIGLVETTMFLLIATMIFGVPFRGSLILLYGAVIVFLASVIGVGLFISSLAETQQQAFLGGFLFAVPAVVLSGFATPIENMPQWLQTLTLINPLRHFMVIVRGIFLKAMPVTDVMMSIVPMILIAAFTLSVAAWLFRARLA